MSVETIIKSDGSRVPFDPEKLNKWAQFASDNDVSWSDITLKAIRKCYDGCTTKDIHQAMIDVCVEHEDNKHLRMAGRLLIGIIYKEAHGGYTSIPTLKDFYHDMVNRNLWTTMDYSDEELDELNKYLDHDKNISELYSYTALKQMRDKYLGQDLVNRKCYESPQFMFMGCAMQAMEIQPKDRRLKDVIKMYEYLSDLKINLSTPMLVNLRTPMKGLASCCVYTAGDTAQSLAVGDHIAYMMTCASAGIGSHLLTRSKGDPVRQGAVVHQGKLPYYKVIQSAVHANKQACYDDETKVLTNTGFKLFSELNDDDLVAQVHDDGTVDFIEPIEGFVYDVDGKLVTFTDNFGNSLIVTDNHKMVVMDTKPLKPEEFHGDDSDEIPLFTMVEAGDLELNSGIKFKLSADTKVNNSDVNSFLDYLLVLTKVYDFEDGKLNVSTIPKSDIGDLEDHLSYLNDYHLVGTLESGVSYDDGVLTIDSAMMTTLNSKRETLLTRLGRNQLRELIDYMKFVSIEEKDWFTVSDIQFFQEIASISGLVVQVNEEGKIKIDEEQSSIVESTMFTKGEVDYKGKVYCVWVPTNRLIVKRDDLVMVCGNSRGGANTTYYSILDPEIEDLLVLKNPTTVLQKRIRDIDYAVNVNRLFVEKVARNEDWMTISYFYAPDLYDAFYSSDYDKFKEIYESYLDHPKAVIHKARNLAVKMLTESVETGRIYIHYVDEANRHTPFRTGEVLENGEVDRIYSSNLCIAGDQLVATDKGLFTAEELYEMGEELITFDGEKQNKTSKMKLREKNVPTYKITLSNGMTHTVTDYHKIMTDRGLVACKDLEVGVDKAKINREEGIFGSRSDMKDEAFLLGLYEGDGTQYVNEYGDKYIHLDLYSGKTLEIRDQIQEVYNRVHEKYMKDGTFISLPNGGEFVRHYSVPQFSDDIDRDTHIKSRLTSRMLSSVLNFEKGVIPKWLRESDKETQIEYIKGVFYTDGTYNYNENNKCHYLSITSTDKEWLKTLQAMLNNMGVTMGLYISQVAGKRRMPDGKGGSKLYDCKDTWRLVTSSNNDIVKFNEMTQFLEFRGREQYVAGGMNNVRPPQFNKIVAVEYVGDQDVYCPTVDSAEHLFVSNGFITANCNEIFLPTKAFTGMEDIYSDDPVGEIGLCSLSSIVQGRVKDDEYADVAYYTLLFVDNTLEIMDYPFPSLRRTARARRNIGIGMTNLAHDMASRGLSYTTTEGKKHIHYVAERHAYHLYRASLQLAREKGIAEWMNRTKYPQGWLPIDTYNKNVDDVVPNDLHFDWETLREEIIEMGGIRNSTVTAIPPNESSSLLTNTTNSIYPIRSLRVIKTSGTGRNILLAPDYEKLKNKYDIVWDMDMKDVIDLYAIVQKFTDQGISCDLYVSYQESDTISTREILSNFIYMMKMGCKSRYYINSQAGVDKALYNRGEVKTEVIDVSDQCDSCVL